MERNKKTKRDGGKYEGQMERTIKTSKWGERDYGRKTSEDEAEDRKRREEQRGRQGGRRRASHLVLYEFH